MKNVRVLPVTPKRFWMVIGILNVFLLATACGTSMNASPSGSSPTSTIDPCSLLTKDDVSNALGVTIASVIVNGQGNGCTFTTTTLSVELTVYQTGGRKYMKDTLSQIGAFAVTVQGLGDQAFYNNDSAFNTLTVLKGDSAYILKAKDSSQQLGTSELQTVERAMAAQLVSHLP